MYVDEYSYWLNLQQLKYLFWKKLTDFVKMFVNVLTFNYLENNAIGLLHDTTALLFWLDIRFTNMTTITLWNMIDKD